MPPAVAAAAVGAAAGIAGAGINAGSQRRASQQQAQAAQAALDFAREQEAERRREFDVQEEARRQAQLARQRRIMALFGGIPSDAAGWKAAGDRLPVGGSEPPAQAVLHGGGGSPGGGGMLDMPGAAPPAPTSTRGTSLATIAGLPVPPQVPTAPPVTSQGLPPPDLPTPGGQTLADLMRRRPYGTV